MRVDRRLGEQNVRPGDVLGEPVSPRDLETLLEPRDAADAEGRDAERGECVDGDLRVFETVRKLERASGPAGRLLRPLRGEAVRREVRVGHRQLPPSGERLEQRDGFARPTLRLRSLARAPEEIREPAKHVAFPEPVAQRGAAFERFSERCNPLVVLIGHVAGARAQLEKCGALTVRKALTEAEGTCVLSGSLAVSAERGARAAAAGAKRSTASASRAASA